MDLKKGYTYKIIKGVQKFGELLENNSYVYLGEKSDWMIYDRFPEYLIRRIYYFYDSETGKTTDWVIDGKEDLQDKVLSQHLQEMEGWPRPKIGEVKSVQTSNIDRAQGQENFRSYVPYWKSVIEGEKDIENIYMWLDKHDQGLKTVLTNAEVLKFRFSPFTHICEQLDYFKVTYQIHPRYGWLDKIVH